MTEPHVTAPVRDQTMDLLSQLPERSVNFTRDDGPFDREHGWKVDDRCGPLPDERPGPPEPDGPFTHACRLLAAYGMADPSIIRAVYDPTVPLAQRDMALEGRFTFLRFPMGVRITSVIDDTSRLGGQTVRRWGWGYTTLEGHLEQGHMDWEIWKWLDSGDVEFRIHAFSRRGRIDNPIVRLGFALFGTWMQERFYDGALARMREQVAAATGRRSVRASCHTHVDRSRLGSVMGRDAA